MFGATYQYSTAANWFIEYRYFGADSVRLESNPDANSVLFGDLELESNNVFGGIRFRF